MLTGSHPEYHTPQTLDALAAYTAGGGRLCYLGGNGFYWRIAVADAIPDVIEVRRAEGGIRAWAAEPGEAHHQLDGAYGGLWRRNGRPPQKLAGVGFSAQGLFEGIHYRRLPAPTTRPCLGLRRRRGRGAGAITACPAAARPGSSWTAPTAGSARRPTPSSWPARKHTRPISSPCRRSC